MSSSTPTPPKKKLHFISKINFIFNVQQYKEACLFEFLLLFSTASKKKGKPCLGQLSRRLITTFQFRCDLHRLCFHFIPCGSILLPGYFSCLCILSFCNQRSMYIIWSVYPMLICIEKTRASPTTPPPLLTS